MAFYAGLVASLQANELPNPVVEVSVVDNPAFRTYEVAAARTLQVRIIPEPSQTWAVPVQTQERELSSCKINGSRRMPRSPCRGVLLRRKPVMHRLYALSLYRISNGAGEALLHDDVPGR